MGVYNEAREQQVNAAKQFVPQVMAENETIKTQLMDYDSWFQRIFTDEKFYESAREKFLEDNTPEIRARRAEERLVQERTQYAAFSEQQTAVNYSNNEIVPAIAKIIAGNPLVTEQEVIGHYNQIVAPFLAAGRGRVPYAQLPEVKRLVETELAHQVKSRQLALEEGQSKVTKKVTAAQTAAQVAKRQVAKVVAPQGSVAQPQPKKQKFETVKDWLDTMFPQTQG